jgi:hypothetical protein
MCERDSESKRDGVEKNIEREMWEVCVRGRERKWKKER